MRRPDWTARLRETVAAHERAFDFGTCDCGLFAARCVDAITGSAFAGTLRHASRREAVRFLREEGGLEAAVTRRLGAPVPGHGARRGDVCLLSSRGLGVCMGATVRAFTRDGLDVLPLSRVRKHWRVA